ncbi:hypothetical protein [Nitrosomonas communis]|uniref:Lipoprotein n=1 Tax=Nitrosomonas communis TaxID=44574 RepID=A0A1I4SYZ7_9PROT|nr:hypothetical protein [Nitrosomonas communis]SFM69684.1 hypothetical protein SAMN05421863_10458 [Nitrosomonas communis]
MTKKMIVIMIVFLTACASIRGPKEQPWIYEEPIAGNHADLARCVVARLQADSRWSIRMLQFSNRLYQDIDASEIYAYDTRFLPGIFARNSPTNPDAVFDYVAPNPEIRSYHQGSADVEPAYAFVLMIKKIDDNRGIATLKGNKHVGSIAWQHLKTCALTRVKS